MDVWEVVNVENAGMMKHRRRLDASAPSLLAHVPEGYGNAGFQATGIIFPTEACREVTGKVAEASLA